MNSRNLAILALFIVALIYGLNYSIAKDVMPNYVKPFGFIFLRVTGATLIFWTLGLFVKEKSIEKEDFKKIAFAAFFGVGINFLSFFKGLSLTTPINASVIAVIAPIMVLIFSSILLKEKLTYRKIVGVFVGLFGAIILILYGNSSNLDGKDVILGNFLVFLNAVSFGLYLVLVKKLATKYHPILFVKWLYLFGVIYIVPFSTQEAIEINWQTMPTTIYYKVGFVVLLTTCVTYLFNLFALTKLKPTTVGVFIYLQPVIATIYALLVGSDSLSFVKVVATIIIFLGVYLVTKDGYKSTK